MSETREAKGKLVQVTQAREGTLEREAFRAWAEEKGVWASPAVHAGAASRGEGGPVPAGKFELREDPQPPWEKLKAMKALDAVFASTWERTRRNLKDRSQSGYDLALASRMADVGWTDQEIVDSLVWHRLNGLSSPKQRPDYYARTLALARSHTGRSQEALQQALDDANGDTTPETPEGAERRQTVLEALQDALGLQAPLTAVRRYLRDGKGHYVLEIGGEAVALGPMEALLAWRTVAARILDVVGLGIPPKKAAEWMPLVEGIRRVAELVDMGEESSLEGELRSWVEEWLDASRVGHGDRDVACAARQPWIEEGRVFLPLRQFVQFIGDSRTTHRITEGDMRIRLKTLGWAPEKVNYAGVSGERLQMRCWGSPQEWVRTANVSNANS